MAVARRSKITWWLATILLLVPVLTVWNLTLGKVYPALNVRIGASLSGVTDKISPDFSLARFRDHDFQKVVGILVGEALPIRPFLIRLNNQIAFSLFSELNVPTIALGDQGQLIEKIYLQEYCSRRSGLADELAQKAIPVLLDIQSYYRARGVPFLYVITPSKVADAPEYFVHADNCPAPLAARTTQIPRYAELLRAAGVAIFDGATFTHELKASYPVAMFPRGGIHWNAIGSTRTTMEIARAINLQGGREIIRPFDFKYTLDRPTGADRDLASLINVLFPPVGYQVPKLEFSPATSCTTHPDRSIDAAVVGDSFMHAPTQTLTEAGCLSNLSLYFYLRGGRFAGVPHHRVQSDLGDADLRALRDVKLLILDENEASVGRSSYVEALQKILHEP